MNEYRKKGRPAKGRKITSGGITQIGEERARLDIVLQSPEIFHFDMQSYMSSLSSATAIDMYSRSRLYDIYNSILLDLHLTGVINKRLTGVSRIPIEFRRDGKPDDNVNAHLRSPWFRRFVKDLLWSKFWGFTLMQFRKDDRGWIDYDLIDRKHFDPVKREVLRYESDNVGAPIEDFADILYVSEGDRDLGMLAKIAPMVLYKRGNIGDWAEFCQIFGMPIREYTYNAGDEEARLRLLADARKQGANAVYIHPDNSTLNLIESSNKSGTVDLYERFANMCNTEISIAILGNTLTTDAKSTGTQSLGTVHKEEEDQLKEDDRDFILDVLNYDMADIFASLGVDVAGGEFCYVEKKKIDKTVQINVVEKLSAMGLPISDDYLYETFDIDKPEDYEKRKADMEEEKRLKAERAALLEKRLKDGGVKGNGGEGKFIDRLKGFFAAAPQDGAPLKY